MFSTLDPDRRIHRTHDGGFLSREDAEYYEGQAEYLRELRAECGPDDEDDDDDDSDLSDVEIED